MAGTRMRTDATPSEQERVLVDAAAHEFADVGIRRANMDLVARRAGVSRSTLYRRFPNKEELLTAVLRQTSTSIGRRIVARIDGMPPTDAIVEAFRVAVAEVDASPLLRRIMTSDTDLAGSIFGFLGPDMAVVLDTISTGVADALRAAGATMPDGDLRVAAELLVRLCTSLIQAPSPVIDFADERAVTEFGEKFLAKLVW
ncbi:TetR/AcrR family transcriptional regulator [Nocardia bovistercoris]|uniref:TetR/AcrR family transcriptional regulator n=1 Tax=Nocardia bovistercoris TaxID=2785916 RepID=A0A931I9Y1_9NOCA|nr:TetR/AcrR family transcriptional regulator [Nocardia bovistercoris]MBH0776761.1 TetR/AcrR family transcriptional regulator [Nocardia bovistercoris]